MQRSKDDQWMNQVKEAVLGTTKGLLDREERKYALDAIRAHVKIDDLRKMAVRTFPGKVIDFGEGSFNPSVVVLTKDRITKEQKEKLEKAWRKIGVPETEVFYTHLRFVKTKRQQHDRLSILERLINILSPKVTIIFDGLDPIIKGETLLTRLPISVLTEDDRKEERKQLTQGLRDCRKFLAV